MSRSLRTIYLLRAAFAAVWVTVVSFADPSNGTGASGGLLAGCALAAYPAVDLIASVADLRSDASGRATTPQALNAVLDVGAVLAVIIGASLGVVAAMNAYAGWAILSGVIQLILGGRRLRRLRGQWMMMISGAGSIVAGTTFVDWSRSSSAALHALAQYSTGGAVWYLLAALCLAWPPRAAMAARLP